VYVDQLSHGSSRSDSMPADACSTLAVVIREMRWSLGDLRDDTVHRLSGSGNERVTGIKPARHFRDKRLFHCALRLRLR